MTEAAPAAPAPIATEINPGKTMGIVGLVMAFFAGLNIAGLILSIIALNKSKKAGFKNGPALAGIIVSIVTIIIGVVVIILLVVAATAGVTALQEMCEGMPTGVYELEGGGTINCG